MNEIIDNALIDKALKATLYKVSEKGFSGSIGDINNNLVLTVVKGARAIGSYELSKNNDKFSLRYYKLHGDSKNLISEQNVTATTGRVIYNSILEDLSKRGSII